MRYLRRPSPATVLAFIALMVALGGTALAATGQLVNITDPVTAANKAKVDAGGHLYVGDGSGPMSVDGKVGDGRLSTAFRQFGFAGNGNCSVIAAAPAGKALVITQLVIDGYGRDSAVSSPYVAVFVGGASDCSGPLLDYFDFQTNESRSADFEPGLVVQSGQYLTAEGFGMTGAMNASGYIVASSAAPAAATLHATRAPSRR